MCADSYEKIGLYADGRYQCQFTSYLLPKAAGVPGDGICEKGTALAPLMSIRITMIMQGRHALRIMSPSMYTELKTGEGS